LIEVNSDPSRRLENRDDDNDDREDEVECVRVRQAGGIHVVRLGYRQAALGIKAEVGYRGSSRSGGCSHKPL